MNTQMLTVSSVSLLRRLVLLGAAGILAACAVSPTALTDATIRDRVRQDQTSMYKDQEPVTGPISREEAVARALKYNLDYRLKVMEAAMSVGITDVSRFDMMPSLLTSAGYTSRSNTSGGTSVNIETGQVSLAPSTSQEKNRTSAAAVFSWNVLDFGVSYFRAREQANQSLIAEERRRRVVQNIIQDVNSAYWRAVGAQRLARDSEALDGRVKNALQRSREAERQGLIPPREALEYQRVLLDAVALLAIRRQELAFAMHELRALMNIPPGVVFTVLEVDEPPLYAVRTDTSTLEDIALRSRPELLEEDYRERVTADEARRQLLAFLPNLQITADGEHDSNKYLYNDQWFESGARVGMNLFKLLSLPATKKLQQAQKDVDSTRRLALSMAIITQVRIAIESYRLTLDELEVARESSLVDQRLASFARAGLDTRADSELELIRAEARALNSGFQRYSAYANAQTAFARISNSIGMTVIPENIADTPVKDLGQQFTLSSKTLERDTFPAIAMLSDELPPVGVRIVMAPANGVEILPVRAAIEAALARNQIPTLAADATGPILEMRLALDPVRDGVRQAAWELRLAGPDDKEMGSSRYTSALPATVTTGTLAAFGEAAAVANVRAIGRWLNTGYRQP